MKYLPLIRIFVQVAVIALFCLLPWLHMQQVAQIKGSLFAFDVFGIPFADPASGAQACLTGLIQGESPIAIFFLGIFATLGIALLLGRVFCGWICPYGFLSDLLSKLRNQTADTHKWEFISKSVIVIGALGAGSLFFYPVISLISMPGQLSLLPQLISSEQSALAITAMVALPIITLAGEVVFGKRLWCRYLCPQSVFLGIFAKLLPKRSPGLRIHWNGRQCVCGKSSPCRIVCNLGLNPRNKAGPNRRDCTMCGDCIAQCSKRGCALKFRLLPQRD